jgi:antitoxin component of MazEF toxin-antitoxin module
MDIVKLGKSGQIALPKALLRELGVEGSAHFAAEASQDGAIVLRPVGIYPIETYSEERISEFMEADRMTPAEARQVNALREATARRDAAAA